MKPKILFFGTPHFAAEILEYLLLHEIPVVGIVTQPDRPKGRSLEVKASAVKETALRLVPHLPILQPEKASEPSFLETITMLGADLYVVVAFGQILPQKLLDIPRWGCINVHASLLPKYRGAAPIHRAIMNGEKKTGIAIQKMVKKLDAGDVIAAEECDISPNMTFAELEKVLCDLSKPLLLSVILSYAHGIPPAIAQDPTQVTFAAKVELEEGHIDWNFSTEKIHNLVRAFSPKPGAWVWIEMNGQKKRLKILRTLVLDQMGEMGEISSDGTVYCKEGALKLLEVQPEGKRPMNGADWLRGLKQMPKIYRENSIS